MIKKNGEAEFEEVVLKSTKPVLVDFFATWCGPCQMLLPVLEKLASEEERFDIIEIDIDNAHELAIKYGVEVVPTMMLFKDGYKIKEMTGFHSEAELKEELAEVL